MRARGMREALETARPNSIYTGVFIAALDVVRERERATNAAGGMRANKIGAPKLDWPFAQQCARALDLDDLRDLLAVEFAHLGFRYFCCCSHVRPDRPSQGAIYLHNYPRPWVEHYNRAK